MTHSNPKAFLSFRRVNYHAASLAYRDLLFSGLVPWLSDHCIATSEAFQFLENPDSLSVTLKKAIHEAGCAFALVDAGYWDSPWTKLEFDEIIANRLLLVITLLDGCPLPGDVARRLPKSALVLDSLEAGVEAVCRLQGRVPVNFSGQALCSFVPDVVESYRFWSYRTIVPHILSPAGVNHWANGDGDQLWFRTADVRASEEKRICEALRMQIPRDELYELFESQLWCEARRLDDVISSGVEIIGYHKLPVVGVATTALAFSLRSMRAVGFCRYATLVSAHCDERIEMVCFLRGSLQRFQALIPDIDRVLTQLTDPEHGDHSGTGLERQEMELGWADSGASLNEDFIYARCRDCLKRAELSELESGGNCEACGSTHAECMNVHCRSRKVLTFVQLRALLERERRDEGRAISVQLEIDDEDDPGTLCESCLSSLVVPGARLQRLMKESETGLSWKWQADINLALLGTVFCVAALFLGDWIIMQLLLCTWGVLAASEVWVMKPPNTALRRIARVVMTLAVLFGIGASFYPTLLLAAIPTLLATVSVLALDAEMRFRFRLLCQTSLAASFAVLGLAFKLRFDGPDMYANVAAIVFCATISLSAMIICTRSDWVGNVYPRTLWKDE